MLGVSSSAFLEPESVLRKIGLRAEQTLVHLGCGAGFWLIPAAQIVGVSGKVIGVDIRPDILSEAASRAQREHLDNIVHTVRGDLERDKGSRLEDEVADLVLVANILHQADSIKILKEAKRLAKVDGRIIVIEWDVAASPMGPPPDQRISEPEVRQIAEGLGLDVMESFTPSPYHYGLILA